MLGKTAVGLSPTFQPFLAFVTPRQSASLRQRLSLLIILEKTARRLEENIKEKLKTEA
jgi:hypothetical protein